MTGLSNSRNSHIVELDYHILSPDLMPNSVSVFDSDHTSNAILMEHLVGTLVKFGNSGRAEPFLASSWRVLDNGTVYEFEIKEGLKAENGDTINANTFVSSFLRSLRLFIQKTDPPTFKDLVGYHEFKSGSNTIDGVQANSKKVVFKFNQRVSGVLEFLSMPYFGFYSKENFSANGEWKDNRKIISSSDYSLNIWKDKKIVLTKRRSSKVSGAHRINVKLSNKDVISKMKNSNSIISADNLEINNEMYNEFVSIPTHLTNLVLSTKKGVFKDPYNRKLFRKMFQMELSKIGNLPSIKSLTETFYFSNSGEKKVETVVGESFIGKLANITIGTTQDSESSDITTLKNVFEKIFSPFGIEIKWEFIDKSKKGWVERFLAHDSFDIRLATVNSGSYPINWVVEMMFCSTLGISFPDPSGRICELVELKKKSKMTTDEYRLKFESIIRSDSAVIPFIHRSRRWYVSRDIESSTLDPTSSVIRFDLIKLNK